MKNALQSWILSAMMMLFATSLFGQVLVPIDAVREANRVYVENEQCKELTALQGVYMVELENKVAAGEKLINDQQRMIAESEAIRERLMKLAGEWGLYAAELENELLKQKRLERLKIGALLVLLALSLGR